MSVSNGPNLGVMINALTGDNFDAAFRKFLREIDGLVMASVISVALSAPPGSPANGDRYIVGASPTGAWAGQANAIARWTTDDPAAPLGEWEFFTPKTGWMIFSVADLAFYEFTGSAWDADRVFPASVDINGLLIIGKSGSGTGGQIRLFNDAGADNFALGIPGSVGSRDFFLVDLISGNTPFFMDAASPDNAIHIDATGVGIGTATPGSKLAVPGLPVFANNAAAITGGLAAGDFYRTGADPDPVCVVH
ncbi:MAG: DUF2793 domain-containing protein [Candidatus Acidiferrales bacterium]